jgi:hypothetical protein
MKKSEILNKISLLTNNFTGGKNMGASNATQNKFKANINNTSSTHACTVALLPGHYDTIGVISTVTQATTEPYAVSAITNKIHYHDTSELTCAGVVCNTVLDDVDATEVSYQGGYIIMTPFDSAYTINSFRRYVMHNPMILKSMTLHSASTSAYEGNLKIQKTNPFNRPAEIPIELDKFFDTKQFQDGKIDIDFSEDNLEIADDVLMLLVVPASVSVGVTFRF